MTKYDDIPGFGERKKKAIECVVTWHLEHCRHYVGAVIQQLKSGLLNVNLVYVSSALLLEFSTLCIYFAPFRIIGFVYFFAVIKNSCLNYNYIFYILYNYNWYTCNAHSRRAAFFKKRLIYCHISRHSIGQRLSSFFLDSRTVIYFIIIWGHLLLYTQ